MASRSGLSANLPPLAAGPLRLRRLLLPLSLRRQWLLRPLLLRRRHLSLGPASPAWSAVSLTGLRFLQAPASVSH